MNLLFKLFAHVKKKQYLCRVKLYGPKTSGLKGIDGL